MAEEKTENEAHYEEKLTKLHSMINTKKKRTGKIDCAVVMDLTGSMSSYINKMKIELSKLITQLCENNTDIQLKFAFVGYKDFCDGKTIAPNQPYETMTQHFSIIDFSSNMEDVNQFLQKQQANGGGDAPEDVVGGLNQALKLSWQMDSHKIVVLVADDSTHGIKYHNSQTEDEFPNGHPDPLLTLEFVMEQFAKLGATFLIFRLTDQTQIMFDIMKQEFKARQQKIRFVDLREILKQENNMHISKKSLKTKIRKLSGSGSFDSCEDRLSCEEEKCIGSKEFLEDAGVGEKKLIRASSIVNMKITEKILVESGEESYENEDWDKDKGKGKETIE